MEENNKNIITKNSILISRNSPIALVVGVAGFLGSHLSEALLKRGIQVLGIDDFSTGEKINLEISVKSKNFHLLNASIEDPISLKLPRLDYAFLCSDSFYKENPNSKGLLNFLSFIIECKENTAKLSTEKPKVILISTIRLYNNKLDEEDKNLKEGEIKYAKFIKYHKINARIVRLAGLYGPRMHFRENDPLAALINESLLNKLSETQTPLDFTTRSLYIADAINLLLKAVLLGGTSHKIYDGALYTPIKISEVKQILLDPIWHELKGFKPTELPPWTTPNLERTINELSWKPRVSIIEGLKRTISYFKDNNINLQENEGVTKPDKDFKKWSFNNPVYDDEKNDEEKRDGNSNSKKNRVQKKIPGGVSRAWKNIPKIIALVIILLGLQIPIQTGVGLLNIRNHIKQAAQFLKKGDFDKASHEIEGAQATLQETKKIVDSLAVIKKTGVFNSQIENINQITTLTEEGLEGVAHTISGTQALFQTTKIISGELNTNPEPLYQKAQLELNTASQKISKAELKLSDERFISNLPYPLRVRAKDFSQKIGLYSGLIEKTRTASYLLPSITALGSKKTYLILLQNNLELRNGGGFIGSYGKLVFENGRIKDILVDDIYNLDGGLKDVIEPPPEIKNDLGQNRLFLRDANYEPDFPSSAREIEFLYKKEAAQTINGVFALDLSGSGKLLNAVGGVELPEYGERVDGNNLFEKAITHAEVNFFPGSQAKKNYLTSLQLQLFNKVFYLSNQNWPEIIKAVGESLDQKHLMIYLADPQVFSYLVSENWAGVMPREASIQGAQYLDFLSVVEANYGANKSNFYLTRKNKLETTFGKEGQVDNRLTINYGNNSPSDVFPAGKYKNRFKIYLPFGTKITKALWGESDITPYLGSFSDYGRAGYTVLLEILPKEHKNLILEYSELKKIQFIDGISSYRLDVVKQPGTDKDPFEWNVTYPINFKLNTKVSDAKESNQEINISTDLQKDRSFLLEFSQK
ncbi:DUF4012 domain-containing protein [Candidatus Daviesbacteria bacterium]|nr:DUF4012 domain-containing protein [Candidatus Daviesbacteria bacterium]